MLEDKRMIMIGSTGRNSGKTSLASQIISTYKDKYNLVALKVTTIAHRHMKCPRGGEGCGVCTSLKGDYDIREEENKEGMKDTQRLKAAGSPRVFWIRAYPDHLIEAYEDFKSRTRGVELIVCESNSLRNYLKPGLFVMIDNKKIAKKTAAAVYDQADLVLPDLRDKDLDRALARLGIDDVLERAKREGF